MTEHELRPVPSFFLDWENNMPRYLIVKAVQTCFACPSQWDAWTDTGQYLYLRYRHGVGTVEEFDDTDPATWPVKDPEISFEYGGDTAGVISLEEFAEQAGLLLALEGDNQ